MGNLVLTRKVGESILIGDLVKVTVTRINCGQIKIAIEAPKFIKVLRGELRDGRKAVVIETESKE